MGKVALLTAGWGGPVPGKCVQLTVQPDALQRHGLEGILSPNQQGRSSDGQKKYPEKACVPMH